MHPRYSVTLSKTKDQWQKRHLKYFISKKKTLPNLKQTFVGQSTDFAVHELSPTQHWIDWTLLDWLTILIQTCYFYCRNNF